MEITHESCYLEMNPYIVVDPPIDLRFSFFPFLLSPNPKYATMLQGTERIERQLQARNEKKFN